MTKMPEMTRISSCNEINIKVKDVDNFLTTCQRYISCITLTFTSVMKVIAVVLQRFGNSRDQLPDLDACPIPGS